MIYILTTHINNVNVHKRARASPYVASEVIVNGSPLAIRTNGFNKGLFSVNASEGFKTSK